MILQDSENDAPLSEIILNFWSVEEIEQNTRLAREQLQPQNSFPEGEQRRHLYHKTFAGRLEIPNGFVYKEFLLKMLT